LADGAALRGAGSVSERAGGARRHSKLAVDVVQGLGEGWGGHGAWCGGWWCGGGVGRRARARAFSRVRLIDRSTLFLSLSLFSVRASARAGKSD